MFRGLFYALSDNSPDEDGAFGEMIVNSIIRKKPFCDEECYLFKDLYIEDDRGVHQIDHIFIRKNGIFVVETKNIRGAIQGTDENRMWTVIYSKTEKRQMYNPILQNKSHIQSLEYILGNMYDYHSCVVFPFYKKPSWCKNKSTFTLKEFMDYLQNCKADRPLSHEDMDYIKGVLSDIESHKKELRTKHIEQLKNKK